MQQLSPERYLRLIAEHAGVLRAIFERTHQSGTGGIGALSELEIKALLLEHHPKQSSADLLTKLLDNRALERTPRESHIELPKALAQLLANLLSDFRLSDPSHIGQFANTFADRAADLREAATANNRSHLNYAAEDVQDQIESLRRIIDDNHQALLIEVAKVKTQASEHLNANVAPAISTRERYDRISMVWTKYLEPMEKIIRIDGPLDDSFTKLNQALAEARQGFRYDRSADTLLASNQDRLTRLRREALERFRASFQEILPLCQRLYRDSALATGAARLLEDRRLQHRNPAGIHAINALATANASTNNLLDDRHIQRQILLIKNYQPLSPQPLPIPQEVPPETTRISDENLHSLLGASKSIDDVLGALIQEYPDATPRAVLSAYHRILEGKAGPSIVVMDSRVTHAIGHVSIDAVKVGWRVLIADSTSATSAHTSQENNRE